MNRLGLAIAAVLFDTWSAKENGEVHQSKPKGTARFDDLKKSIDVT